MRCATERRVGDITVLDLASRAMLGELNTEVTDRIESLVAEGRRRFILNLDGVSSLDSNGLGDLVGAWKAVVARGGVVKLTNVHERVAYPLKIMNVSKTFDCFGTEDDALRSFAGSPESETAAISS